MDAEDLIISLSDYFLETNDEEREPTIAPQNPLYTYIHTYIYIDTYIYIYIYI